MTPLELTSTLHRIVQSDIRVPVFLWGAPGIGKSSIVAQVADEHELEVVDLRLSQLAPTDLRGLPVPEDGPAAEPGTCIKTGRPSARSVLFAKNY